MGRPEIFGEGAFGIAACPTDDLDPFKTAEIDHGGADTAGSPIHINSLNIGPRAGFFEQTPCNGVVGNAHGSVEIDLAGQCRHNISRHRIQFCMTPAACAEDQHRLAQRQMTDAGADADNVTAHFVADNGGQFGHPLVHAAPEQHVGFADTEGMGLDQHLARARRRVGQIYIFQNLRPAGLRELYCFHATTIISSLSCCPYQVVLRDARRAFRLASVTPMTIRTAPTT